jgi:tRNA A-37 threonylcarbamoyl transferase component Bud32/membrane-associated phospholipid phosphatase
MVAPLDCGSTGDVTVDGATVNAVESLRDVHAPGRLTDDVVVLTARRRRPSGEAPPLPRDLHRSGRLWFGVGVATVVFWLLWFATDGAVARPFEEFDRRILRTLADWRTPTLTSVMRVLHGLGSDWSIRIFAWTGLLVPLAFKRVRHTLVFFGSLLVVKSIVALLAALVARPRPVGVEIIGAWEGFSHPSAPVADLAVTLLGLTYTLVPQGRWRQGAKWLTGALVVALGLARVYLGVDHPTDVAVAVIMGVAVPLVAFRLLVPNEVFPVTYRRGRTAHLDVGGRRGAAIRRALEDQLGIAVRDIRPFGLAGSAGSTPLRIEVDDEADTVLFGKLYAATHLRADRWYKLGRTLLYGRLEDESTFSTVRRLVQYEDYLLRLMQAAGVPSAEPYGFVEITPEREYLLVTEFLAGTEEIGEVEVNDDIIDDALRVVRKLWDSGLAHRDIKPSNVLVRDGRVVLIDVAFGEVRPSPWRQAVDLANMMLTLALRTTPHQVYARAVLQFSPSEISEAFAATYKITSPTQLRSLLRADNRDLVTEFRRLAPYRRPISIQHWSVRRIGLWGAVLLCALLTLLIGLGTLSNARLL